MAARRPADAGISHARAHDRRVRAVLAAFAVHAAGKAFAQGNRHSVSVLVLRHRGQSDAVHPRAQHDVSDRRVRHHGGNADHRDAARCGFSAGADHADEVGRRAARRRGSGGARAAVGAGRERGRSEFRRRRVRAREQSDLRRLLRLFEAAFGKIRRGDDDEMDVPFRRARSRPADAPGHCPPGRSLRRAAGRADLRGHGLRHFRRDVPRVSADSDGRAAHSPDDGEHVQLRAARRRLRARDSVRAGRFFRGKASRRRRRLSRRLLRHEEQGATRHGDLTLRVPAEEFLLQKKSLPRTAETFIFSPSVFGRLAQW